MGKEVNLENGLSAAPFLFRLKGNVFVNRTIFYIEIERRKTSAGQTGLERRLWDEGGTD